MNDLDALIKQELEKETSEIDELLARDGGIPDMIAAAFKGSMRRWVWLMAVITMIASGVMLWCGFHFYNAVNADDRMFWGVWLIVSLTVQVSVKQWSWMEMHRAFSMREIKRLELAIVSLRRSVTD